MIIEFYSGTDQKLTQNDIQEFETRIGKILPNDYKQHMLEWNGGDVLQYNLEHVNFPEHPDYGLSDLFPISHNISTISTAMNALGSALPINHIPIGSTRGDGTVLMCLENDESYGKIRVMFSEGVVSDMSPTFSQFLEDFTEGYDYDEDD